MASTVDTPAQQPRPPPLPRYRTPAGEAVCRRMYDAALAVLPYPHDEILVNTTSYGAAHVTACGPRGAPPLVLHHGQGAPAPFMLRMFDPLIQSGRFRVYCPDLPGHAGSRSQDADLDPSKHEQGRWMLEVLRGLGLAGPGAWAAEAPPVHIGVSFGAASVLDLAAVAPDTIRAAALVVPGGLMPGDTWAIMLKLVLPSLLYRLLPCAWTARLALSGMCDEPQGELDFVLANWKHVARYPAMPGGPAGFTPDQLKSFSAPTLVVAAERDLFWRGHAAAAAACRLVPGCETVVLPGTKHLPAKHKLVEVNQRLLDFFASRSQAGMEE